MGKLTSMHFYGWKKGLKTGMYYLRTMAASAAIQFTVDKEALMIEDKTVARTTKRNLGLYQSPANGTNGNNGIATNGYSTSNGPSPMMNNAQKSPAPITNGNGASKPLVSAATATKIINAAQTAPSDPFKADTDEGESPKLLTTSPATAAALADEELQLDAKIKKLQVEDDNNESNERDHDIYADAVLQCSIDNKEDCMMCSG